MIDINGENIRVWFEEKISPVREVPAYSVRRFPQHSTCDSFDPKVDEEVEVVKTTESNPSGLALGRVDAIKNSFDFITFVGNHKRP